LDAQSGTPHVLTAIDGEQVMQRSQTDRQAEIYGCFDGLSDIHPDKSTEFLLQLTADVMKCSYGDVADALQAYTLSYTKSGGAA
jgi:hypothetical protein